MKAQSVLRNLGMAVVAMLSGSVAYGQLTIDTSTPANQMVQNLVGNGVQITNVSVTAAPNSYGFYTAAGTELGSSQGLLLTTGRATNAIGPNTTAGTGLPTYINGVCQNCDQFNNNFPGDSLLNLAQNRTTFDACRIEFDIVPQGDSLSFAYSFASEEYLEWVGSPFNDVFGFYISGPNIGTDVNIALIPGTGQSVAINNVNSVANSQYFFNNRNPLGQFIAYDGFTRNLVARVGGLIPCEVYHLELVIADGSDRFYDSGVFVQKIESNPVLVLTSTAGGLDFMVEGCNDGTITFERDQALPTSQSVAYWIGGTAINGVDYAQIGNLDPNSVNSVIIPANQTSVSIDVTPFADALEETGEYITIFLDNPNCTNLQVLDSVNFFISDFLETSLNPDTLSICAGGCGDVNITLPAPNALGFTWSPIDGVSDLTSLTPQICATTSGYYTVTSQVADCISSDSVFVSVSNLSIQLDVQNSACSDAGAGAVEASVSGAIEPVTYAWEGPDGFTSDQASITGLAAGEYCVTVTDGNGCIGNQCATVTVSQALEFGTPTTSNFQCFPISCNGACDGTITVSATGGTGAYTYSWSNGASTATISNLCAGTYTVTITDEAGCEITEDFVLEEPAPLEVSLAGSVDLLCTGTSTGQITVNANGGCGPYLFTWSHDPLLSTNVANNLASGTYTVNVSDRNNCASTGALDITVNPPIDPISAVIDEVSLYPGGFNVSCPDATDGFINTTVSGGTLPYSVSWVNVGELLVISNSQDVANLGCGLYRLQVADANGCSISIDQTISCVPDIQATIVSQPNPCDSPNANQGSITVQSVSGGNGNGYTFEYTGPGCAPCTGTELTNVASGSYTVVITDGEGCSTTQTVNVDSNDSFIINGVTTDPSCADGSNGAIDITPTPSGNYIYQWQDGSGNTISTSEDIAGLPAGTYTVTVSNSVGGSNATMNVNGSTVLTATFEGLHSFVSDLEWHLVGPASCGSPDVLLAPRRGGTAGNCNSTDNFTQLSFTNAGGANFDVCELDALGVIPISGSYSSYGASFTPIDWSVLQGCNVLEAGWSLQVWDCVGGDSGTLNGASLSFTGTDSNGTVQTISYSGGGLSNPISDQTCNSGAAARWDVPAEQIPTLTGGGTPGGCTSTLTFTLNNPDPLVPFLLEAVNPSCFGVNNGSINVEVIGGTAPYLFQWSPSGFFPGATTEDISGLAAGTYNLIVTDANGCTGSFTWSLNAPQVMDISIQVSSYAGGFNVSCADANDGEITVNVSGGTPDCTANAPYCYNYDWAGGISGTQNLPPLNPTSQSWSGVQPGTYTVNVTDANGCLATTTVDITEPDPIDAQATISNVSCNGAGDGEISYTITGGSGTYVDFDWSPSVAPNDPSASTLTNLDSGCYTLTVTDNNQCTSEFEFCITEPEAIEVSASATEIDCATQTGATITVTATGGTGVITVTTDGPGGPYTGDVVGPLEAGTYTITATDENGCFATTSVDIVAPEPFDITITPVLESPFFTLSCFGDENGALTASPNGGTGPFTYEWTDENENVLGTEAQVNGLSAGTYCVNIADNTGCSAQSCFTITQPDTPITTNSSVSVYNGGYNISCFGACDGSIAVEVTGGVADYLYLWNDGNGLDTNPTQNDLCAQLYNLLITDANGCDTLLTFELTEPSPIIINSTVSQFDGGFNISCNAACDGTITIEALGGEGPYSIDWTNPVLASNFDQADLCDGTYELTITDALGCTEETTVTLTQPEVLTATATATYSCLLANNEMCVTISGGSGAYTQTWSNGATGLCATVTEGGNYCVDVNDSNGCNTNVCVDAVVYPLLDPEYATVGSTCGQNNGSITTTVNGGSGNFAFDWSGPGVAPLDQNQTNLPGGLYTNTVTDTESGCQVTENIQLNTSVAVVVDETIADASCFGGDNGSILAEISNGTAPITITWTNAQGATVGNAALLDEVTAGTYTLTWTDGANCTGTENYTVNQADALVIEAQLLLYSNGFNVSGFGGSDGAIDISVTGGTPAYQYDWTHIAGTEDDADLTGLAAGDYTLTVTDQNGCTADSLFTIKQPEEFDLLNGLTPNGDGLNDKYLIRGLSPNKKAELKVFNRWGNLVYENSNYYDQWVGQNKDGEELASGTYFVVFKLGNIELSTYVDLRK